jgi:uncharacterized protein YndB with AHSA1/START domain
MTTNITEREIIIERIINAPRTLVWEAFTTQEHLEKWWGPNGFTTSTIEFDFRTGGRWHHIMHGPDGVDYPNETVYTEIVPYERIAYRNGGDAEGVTIEFETTVSFTDIDGKTKITLHHIFADPKVMEYVVTKHGAIEGGKQHLARLEEFVLTHLQ